ncbi:MAG: hypothetical protein H7Z19_06725 [Chitinophagaceae bacterium]|nr:hypothetical protein [Rubrivivax sp.]
MNATTVESSFLLWALGLLVYWLAAHVGLACVREAQREPGLHGNWAKLLVAGGALGTGMCAGFVLALTAETLAFPVGFRADAGVAAWLVAMSMATAVSLWLALRPGRSSFVFGGCLTGLLALAVHATWLWSAGFRPGPSWPPQYSAAAASVMVIGWIGAWTLASSDGAVTGTARLCWRLAASGLAALALAGGQEILLAGSALPAQVGSVYHSHLPAPAVSLVAGALVPLALVVVALDLALNRGKRRSGESSLSPPAPQRRRRRKYRIRGL